MPSVKNPFWRLAALFAAALLLASCGSPPQKKEDTGPLVFPKPPDPARFVFERTILGTGSVRSLNDRDRLKSLLTGSAVREGLGFSKPFDVAVRKGRIYVTDTVHRSVLALDFPGQNSFTIGDRGDDGDLAKPLGIAVDDAGLVYVVDATQHRVQIYNAQGDFQRFIDLKPLIDRPSGIDVSPDGSRAYLIDTGGVDSEKHRVLIVDARTGELIRAIGTRGKNLGELNLPRDVKVGKDGLLYVTDGGNFRVQVFTQDGTPVKTWGEPGRRLGQFSRPKGISVDRDGNIYVVDAAFGNFQIFDTDGKLLLFVGERSTNAEPAKYMLPAGIDVDEDGRVYIVDQFFRKLDVYRPAGISEQDGWLAKTPEVSK